MKKLFNMKIQLCLKKQLYLKKLFNLKIQLYLKKLFNLKKQLCLKIQLYLKKTQLYLNEKNLGTKVVRKWI